MSDVLKLKVCVGNANIELEGDGTLVQAIFLDLREHGLGMLSASFTAKSNYENTKDIETSETLSAESVISEKSNDEQRTEFNLPTVETIVIKDLPKTEAEWILVYALYASKQGKEIFSEQDIKQLYLSSDRWNESRKKNFATNLKKAVVADWFNNINDSSYSLLPAGREKALEIIQRSSGDNSKKQKHKASLVKPNYSIIELGLQEGQRQEIKLFLQTFSNVSYIDKATLIAYKLAQYGIDEINENTIFTALRIADQSVSYDIKSSLSNAKKRGYFYSSEKTGMFKLHHLGEDRAKELERSNGE